MAAGDRLRVTLLWEAVEDLPADYTAFVHVANGPGAPAAGLDQPPAEDRFPTSRWQAGDHSLSDFDIEIRHGLAPGIYEVRAGAYTTASKGTERLAVASKSLTVRDQSVLLGRVTVR